MSAAAAFGVACVVLIKLICRLWCLVFRWKPEKLDHPIPTPCVVIAAPHTSNWDFMAMLASARLNDLDVKWLGKREMFDGPLGPFFRYVGGVSVDRAAGGGLVEQMAALLHAEADLMVVVPAEGTRDAVEYWRSGFYRIAVEADVPIQLSYVDRATRTSGFGPAIVPSGDVSADMDEIRSFYADKEGIRPDRFSVPRLHEEDEQLQDPAAAP